MTRFHIVLLALLVGLAGCTATKETVTVTRVLPTLTATAVAVANTTSLDTFITQLEEIGAAVTNHGSELQSLFPGATMWQLEVNGAGIRVFEFSDAAAREAVSQTLSPDGSEIVVQEGDTTVVTHMDGEGTPYFWVMDALLIRYMGEDRGTVALLTKVLGEPIADGSKTYRAETPGSGAIAGTGFHGVHFQYDPWLAAELEQVIVPAVIAQEAGGFTHAVLPEHIAFRLRNTYADEWNVYRQTVNIPTAPTILIFPAEALAAANETAAAEVAGLQRLLAERPSSREGSLPMLPPTNGAQAPNAQMAYLTFQNGHGVRYLTQVNQEMHPLNNQELFYTFQGLTEDGTYVVAVFFPVSAPTLPTDGSVEGGIPSPGVLTQAARALNRLALDEFTPDLALLDAVVQSLQVTSDVELKAGETPFPAPEALSIADSSRSVSPDGRWQAEVTRSEKVLTDQSEQFYTALTVSALDGTATWMPVAEWRGAGLGEIMPAPFHWSQDGRFFYYTNVGTPDGCALFINGTDLYRLDLADGSVAELLPPYTTSSLAIAPNERLLAYSTRLSGRLAIAMREIDVAYHNNGEVINEVNPEAGEWVVPLDYAPDNTQVGNLVWSPDSVRLLLTVANEPCGSNWSHSILLIEDLTVTTLIDGDERLFSIVEWTGPETARLHSEENRLWELDVRTGVLTELE